MNLKTIISFILRNPKKALSIFLSDPVKYILCFIKSEVFLYLFFGVLTTLVNLVVYYGLTLGLNVYYMVSEVAAWIAAVAFAYITNRIYVFKSKSQGRQLFDEIWQFLSGRLLTFFLEAGMLKLLVDICGLSEKSLLVKIIPSVFVIIANYFLSKFVIFRKTEGNERKKRHS